MKVKGSNFGLRFTALAAVVIGVIGSISLLRHAQQHTPPLLVVLFVVWVVAPFGVLGVAVLFSSCWPIILRTTLYIVTLCVTLTSLAIYVDDKHRPSDETSGRRLGGRSAGLDNR
jgi:uncharacterized membrane protein